MTEDQMLDAMDIRDALAKLSPANRMMMILISRLEPPPPDWTAAWPPRLEDIGWYIGVRFEGRPLSEAAIRYRRDAVRELWRSQHGGLRSGAQERDVS